MNDIGFLRSATKAGLLALAVNSSLSSAAYAASPNEPFWRLKFSRAATAPSNCPDEPYLEKSLAGKLDGRAPFTEDALRSISVDILTAGSEVEARIKAQDENGNVTTNETLRAEAWRCDLLGERIVFVLQDIVAPIAASSANTQTAPNASPAAPEVTPQLRKDDAPPPGPIPQNPPKRKKPSMIPNLGFAFGIGAAWWNAPNTALSTSFGIEAKWKRFALGLEGQYDHAWAVPNIGDSRAERTGGALVGCMIQPLSKRFYVRGCGFVDIARLSVQSNKIHISSQAAPIVDIAARLGVGALMFSSLGLEVRADGAYVAHRPEFAIDGMQVWLVAPFTGSLRIAVVGEIDVW